MHIRQPPVDAVVSKSQFGVIDAQLSEDCGVNVVDFGGCFAIEWFVAPFVARAESRASLDSPSCQPVCKDKRIMIAALASLSARHSSEFGCPMNDCLVQHSALFEVSNQCRRAACHAE